MEFIELIQERGTKYQKEACVILWIDGNELLIFAYKSIKTNKNFNLVI